MPAAPRAVLSSRKLKAIALTFIPPPHSAFARLARVDTDTKPSSSFQASTSSSSSSARPTVVTNTNTSASATPPNPTSSGSIIQKSAKGKEGEREEDAGTMANVDVQHQPTSHPHPSPYERERQQPYDHQHASTSVMSALQGPLPLSRHTTSTTATATATMNGSTAQTQTQTQTQQMQTQQLKMQTKTQQTQHIPHTPHYSTLRKPIPNSYWATPYLLACEYPWAPSTPHPKLDLLLASGIRTFIDLTVSGELLSYSQLLPLRAHSAGLPPSESQMLEYVRFPIPDRSLPPSQSFLARILAVLARCEREKRIAAIHCRGGIGRTGTVVGCWLVQSGRCKDGEEALRVVAEKWKTVEKCARFPCSPETGPQAEFVRQFKRLDGIDVNVGAVGKTTKAAANSKTSATAAKPAESGESASDAASCEYDSTSALASATRTESTESESMLCGGQTKLKDE